MISKVVKTKIIGIFMAFIAIFFAVAPVLADALTDAANGLDTTREAAGFKKAEEGGTINSILGQAITVTLSMLGVIFVILMIYGGFLWMTARGDESQVTKAKDLITAAIIGVIIVVGAYATTYFIISKAGSGTIQGIQ